jgi:hypothetical protein
MENANQHADDAFVPACHQFAPSSPSSITVRSRSR